MPEDYLNVQTVKLSTWTFPANYNVFSILQSNVEMTFQLNGLYNPNEDESYNQWVYNILQANSLYNYLIIIEEGFYNPTQMATELMNKMNDVVSKYIYAELQICYPTFAYQFTPYTEFVVVYNSVNQKIWFGNRSSSFTLTNNSEIYKQAPLDAECIRKNQLPEFVNWGLPAYIGFTRCPAIAQSDIDSRFYYGDALNRGDNGVWLIPSITGQPAYVLVAPLKINLMGPSCFYMEIAGMNNIDETMPFAISRNSRHTNETNGIVNSAFAKIMIPTTPISQWFDHHMDSYMLYNPPAERLRRLRIKLRYHDGKPVNFGLFDYSFMLEFTLLNPQIPRKLNVSKYN